MLLVLILYAICTRGCDLGTYVEESTSNGSICAEEAGTVWELMYELMHDNRLGCKGALL